MPFENDNKDDGVKTIENQNQPAVDPATQAAAQTDNDHQSVFLVAGERAYQNREAVVKKLENADSHIITLEAERKADREALAAATAEVERLKKIEVSLEARNQPGNSEQTHQMSNDEIATQAAKLAAGIIKQTATEEVQNANLAAAETRAAEAYGKDNYLNKVSEIATSLNMSMKAVDELGKSSPSAFDRLFLPAAPGNSHQPTRSTLNAPTGGDQQTEMPAVNITKMREPERIAHTKQLMEAAGVTY